MKIAITGGTGYVGGFIVAGLQAAGHDLRLLSRSSKNWPYQLGDAPEAALEGCDALVHAAFSHVPGRYRGGEGDDPTGFVKTNLEGSLRLFDCARAVGISRIVFLSSRAAYGDYPPGTVLREEMELRPDTLYGRVKAEAEAALPDGISLRVTGVYGPLVRGHKWASLFADFEAGRPVAPRVATEVHGDDVAQAVAQAVKSGVTGPLNVSDIVLDRRDLLTLYARVTGCSGQLPEPGQADLLNVMSTDRLRELGWSGRGLAGVVEVLAHPDPPTRRRDGE